MGYFASIISSKEQPMQRFLLYLSLYFCFSCASPQKHLQKLNYDKAFHRALKKLEHEKQVALHQDILNEALSVIIEKQSFHKDFFLKNGDLENVLQLNETTLQYLEAAYLYLETSFVDLREKLKIENQYFRAKIAEKYFILGKSNLQKAAFNNNKHIARQAHEHLTKARDFGHPSRNLDALIQESFELAQVVIAIDFDNPYWEYNTQIRQTFQKIEQKEFNFQRIVLLNSNYGESQDCVLKVRFERLDISITENVDKDSYTKEIIDGYKTVEVDTTGKKEEVPIYKEVSAQVETTTITKEAEWKVHITVDAYNGNCECKDWQFWESVSSEREEVDVSGDRRALSAVCVGGSSGFLSSDDYMIMQLIDCSYRRFWVHYFR